jgi:glycosyltransferase involved in cell wall biosynthesis
MLSFVIPAFNAAQTIHSPVSSVIEAAARLPTGWRCEIIIVDDGSPDGLELREKTGGLPGVRIVAHEVNRGMCAARNTGIAASEGDVVMILDADDAMTPDWPEQMVATLAEWPGSSNLCFAACRNDEGRVTVSNPDYSGFNTLEDMLAGRFAGEYVPLFRGEYVRQRLYVDLGTRKSCGVVSYLTFAQDGPIWITRRVLRIYRDRQAGSVTRNWAQPQKAAETARCYEELLARFGEAIRRTSPRKHSSYLLRLAVYRALAGKPQAWRAWWLGARLQTLTQSVGALLIMIAGAGFATRVVSLAKRVGLVKSYG